jgi:antitoxin component YwqK of YwqJK toxin-antitoxin module
MSTIVNHLRLIVKYLYFIFNIEKKSMKKITLQLSCTFLLLFLVSCKSNKSTDSSSTDSESGIISFSQELLKTFDFNDGNNPKSDPEKRIKDFNSVEGLNESFYPNGKIKTHFTFVDKLAEGEFLTYYSNGQVETRKFYKKGLPEGKFIDYDELGGVVKIINYKDGFKVDTCYEYHQSRSSISPDDVVTPSKSLGTVSKMEVYKNGRLHGPYIIYFENGVIDQKGFYCGDHQIGTFERNWRNGKPQLKSNYIIKKLDYSNCKGCWGSYEHGEHIEYYENGNPKFKYSVTAANVGKNKEGDWEDIQMDGDYSVYWENGTLGSKVKYVNGKKEGLAQDWDKNGKPTNHCTYKNGLKDGEEVILYTNGKIHWKGLYKEGLKEGDWFYYYENGNLHEKAFYKEGSLYGIRERYFENGQFSDKLDASNDWVSRSNSTYEEREKMYE